MITLIKVFVHSYKFVFADKTIRRFVPIRIR